MVTISRDALFASLFLKHVNDAAGWTRPVYFKQLVCVTFCSDTCKEINWEDRVCPFDATCHRCFLFPKHVNEIVGRTGCANFREQLDPVGLLEQINNTAGTG